MGRQRDYMTRATEEDIARALANANNAVVLADAERDHWRRSFGTVNAELRVVIGIWMARTKATRIIITAEEAEKLKRSQKLFVSNPDEGSRMYELREGKEAPMPASRFIIAGPGHS